LPRLTDDPAMQTLVIGWVFASFLEGIGGFGVPVAVASPLLVGLGLSPLAAVLAPTVGHAWAISFGSMGLPFQALMAVSRLPGEALAGPSALLLGLACPVSGLMVAHVAGGWPAIRRLWLPTLAWGAVMGGVQYAVVTAGVLNIGAFAGGLAGLAATPLLVKYFVNSRRPSASHLQPTVDGGLGSAKERPGFKARMLAHKPLLIALSGYAIVVAVTLLLQLVPALKRFFGQVVLQVQFPETRTALGYLTPAGSGSKINLFGHTGSLLLYACILTYLVYRLAGLYQSGAVRRILEGTVRRVLPSSVSIVSMICMAVIMEQAGMTDTLARGLAASARALFPFFSPWIGALGAFMTGSNTNSNVVFGALQMNTAQLLGYAAPVILAAQTAGAGLASVAAPAKVVVGASTAGMAGKEGEVLRRLAPYVAILILIVSAYTIINLN